ncbi:penicillin acylase family protein [Ferrimonas marina]|uniref:Penicillin amidase n=1 Tax=Ferrimonas marina TaxID=299255 RepID=A0A1M5Z574_9GAMM|nr:penicillin acylase family protein [Ferrimonas marina]SHI19341.1 penicillin amidase [Ferrimonas marina]
MWQRAVWWGLAAVLALAAVAAGLIWTRVPATQGSYHIEGLQAPVAIELDLFGVPSIAAANDLDAWQALGWLHARERLFQMDLLRRVGKGEVAALMGADALPTDQLFRTLGTRDWSETQAASLPQRQPELTELVDAYLSGVNQAIDTLPTPTEYLLLGASPEPFERVDIYATLSYMAHSFTSAFRQDPLLTELLHSLPSDHHPSLTAHWQSPLAQGSALPQVALNDWYRQIPQLDQWLPLGQLQGSNAWVVSAQRSNSGAPLFANDPHISFSSPQVWYEAQIHSPSRQLYGHFLPGLPLPLLGQTPSRVWGLTMLLNDDADLYLLERNLDSYQVDGQWRPMTSVKHSIPVKGSEPVALTVEQTELGPLVDEVLALPQSTALNWTFTLPDNQPLIGLYGLVNARSLMETEQSLEAIWSPGVNLMYADTEGNIAKWAVARYIRRADGVSGGTLIDGSNSAHWPQGYYPFEQNPRSINPESGMVFSANHPYQAPLGEQEASHYYAPKFRPQRLAEQLERQQIWSIDAFQQLQTDSRNLRFDQLLALLPDSARQHPLGQTLLSWDGQYRPDAQAPALFEQFYHQLQIALFQPKLTEQQFDALLRQGLVDKILFEALADANSPWWQPQPDAPADRSALIQTAWDATLANEPTTWGEQVRYRHRHAMGVNGPLQWLFEGPRLGVTGSKRAINNVSYPYRAHPERASFGPSTRRLVDLAQPDKTWVISPLGQSGHRMSVHFADQAQMYQRGEYRTIALQAPRDGEITLLPEAGSTAQ